MMNARKSNHIIIKNSPKLVYARVCQQAECIYLNFTLLITAIYLTVQHSSQKRSAQNKATRVNLSGFSQFWGRLFYVQCYLFPLSSTDEKVSLFIDNIYNQASWFYDLLSNILSVHYLFIIYIYTKTKSSEFRPVFAFNIKMS